MKHRGCKVRSAARRLIEEELLFSPSDHWLWLTLSSTCNEDKDYDKAVACGKRAVELGPGCPLALWHYAGALYMTNQDTAAFATRRGEHDKDRVEGLLSEIKGVAS